MKEIKQFKLTNGEEIVCEVVEYPGEESADLVVRNSYRVTMVSSEESGNHYYAFRPWMIYQDDPEMYQIININQIVGECNPSQPVIDYYFKNVKQIEDVEQAAEKLKEYIQQLTQQSTEDQSSDSDSDNVLMFKPKGSRLH